MSMNNSWGPLGNPTAEEIQKYTEMPYGHFKALTKNLRGKKARMYTVTLTKIVSTEYTVTRDILAVNSDRALAPFRDTMENIDWSNATVKSDVVSYRRQAW